MPRLVAGAAVLLTWSSAIYAATSPKAQILALEQTWLQAAQARDIPVLRRILAANYVDINYKGIVRDRAAALGAPNVEMRHVIQRLSDERVRVFGDSAVVTGRGVLETRKGAMIAAWRFTDVFVMQAGAWRAVSSQETLERNR